MRLKNALAEIEYGQAPGNFEHVIVNDDLEVAFAQLCAAIGLRPPVNNRALIFVKPHAVNPKVRCGLYATYCATRALRAVCVCSGRPLTVVRITHLGRTECPTVK